MFIHIHRCDCAINSHFSCISIDTFLKCDFLFVISCLFRSLCIDYFSSIVNNLGMCAVAKQPLMANWEVFGRERGKLCDCVFTFSQLSFWKMTGHDRWILKWHSWSIKHLISYPSVAVNQSVQSRFRLTV